MRESDEDALWRSIVENYGDRVVLDPTEQPAERPDQPPGERGADAANGPANDPATDPANDSANETPREPEPPPLRPYSPREDPDVLDAWDDPDDHFVPPEPPPLPSLDPPRLLAWVGVLGVPVLVILVAALRISVPAFASFLGLAWFVGGFGYLVATMRRDDDPDPGDDGAVL